MKVKIMTRYMLHYYQKDDGWIEFKTKEQMEEAKRQFEDGESDVSDITNGFIKQLHILNQENCILFSYGWCRH